MAFLCDAQLNNRKVWIGDPASKGYPIGCPDHILQKHLSIIMELHQQDVTSYENYTATKPNKTGPNAAQN